MLDEAATIVEVQSLYGKHARRCGRYEREGRCALPGEIPTAKADGKSAEVIVTRLDHG